MTDPTAEANLRTALTDLARACRFLEKPRKAQLAGMSAGFHAKMLSPATRLKRHGQIMTPIHWEHSWNYFCRKLKARGETADGMPAPVFG